MNCGWPIAPAQDPLRFDSAISPRLRISSALKSSARNNVARRGSHASVARAGTVGRTPVNRPKFDSTPQIAVMICGGTPYFADTWSSSFRCSARFSRPIANDRPAEPLRDVALERQHRLGLRTVPLEHDWERLFDAGERLLDKLGPEAARDRLVPNAREPLGKDEGRRCRYGILPRRHTRQGS